ncbi:hypothetical protein CLOP_g1590 [Closterium sp. NIES-67]|nr:hypothetical protein CLOP_g1590 [Closterium sp. NIES-67]
MDNLEAQTYETFEKDATKYSQYQKAVYAALMDRVPDSEAESSTVVLWLWGRQRAQSEHPCRQQQRPGGS